MHLLDANVLIALLWSGHVHNARVVAWFGRHAARGWASCAITQSAVVRILSQPAAMGFAAPIDELADLLAANIAHPAHRLLPLDFSFPEVMATCTAGIVGHRQITDAWLLTAAIRANAKLVTLDSGVRNLLATQAERARYVLLLS